MLAVLAVIAYAACAAAANYATARYGMVPVGFGLTVTAGTYAAGLALLARDAIQETAGRKWIPAAIGIGAVLSWATSTPQLALASTIAFAIAEFVDFAVYTPLRKRGWGKAAVASGTVGGVVDTVVFLAVAGFPVTVLSVTGQVIGKAMWATLVPVLIVVAWRAVKTRAVPRDTIGAEGL